MNLFIQGILWAVDPANFGGVDGVGSRVLAHLLISFGVVAAASAIAVPLGYIVGHTGRGRALAIGTSGAIRALPTLGLIILLGLGIGIGLTAPFLALVVLAIPSILAGAYAGFEAVDRGVVDAARAVGMTEWQIVTRVEMPLGLPLLIGGLRAASLQVIATATLAAYISGGGLGIFIFRGLKNGLNENGYPQMLAGSILVILLAIASEIIFSTVQRLVVPAGVTAGRPQEVRAKSIRSRAALG